MRLFGCARDQLSHVLASHDFETHPDFSYIPPEHREFEVRDWPEPFFPVDVA
jgi:CRISPR-associated protein (TIGR02584 family)